jgi:putative tryptophan/tyrosine transport system substrate-binding protein
LLHELIPSATTVGLLINPADSESADQPTEAAEGARALGWRLVVFEATTPGEIDTAFAEIARQRIGVMMIGAGAFFVGRRAQIVALAARYAIPTAHSARSAVAEGGLLYYGNDLADAYRRNGVYVGRILKGDRPAGLPIDRASKFELLINLRTAKALGLTVPQILLAQADEVVE